MKPPYQKENFILLLPTNWLKGRRVTIVAMVKSTQAEDAMKALSKIPLKSMNTVKEVTTDMAPSMV